MRVHGRYRDRSGRDVRFEVATPLEDGAALLEAVRDVALDTHITLAGEALNGRRYRCFTNPVFLRVALSEPLHHLSGMSACARLFSSASTRSPRYQRYPRSRRNPFITLAMQAPTQGLGLYHGLLRALSTIVIGFSYQVGTPHMMTAPSSPYIIFDLASGRDLQASFQPISGVKPIPFHIRRGEFRYVLPQNPFSYPGEPARIILPNGQTRLLPLPAEPVY